MILFLFLDILLFPSSHLIPCFFFVGFYHSKKTSLLDYLSFWIIYDLWIYKTYIFFLLTLILLDILKKHQKRKNTVKFNFLFLLFFGILIRKSGLSFLSFLNPKLITSVIIANLLYLTIPNQNSLTYHFRKLK